MRPSSLWHLPVHPARRDERVGGNPHGVASRRHRRHSGDPGGDVCLRGESGESQAIASAYEVARGASRR